MVNRSALHFSQDVMLYLDVSATVPPGNVDRRDVVAVVACAVLR